MINMSALKPNLSRFPFIFFNLSGFSILLNHMSSQGVVSKNIYHATVMIYDTKTISCTIGATYCANDNLNLLKKQNAAQLTVMGKKNCQGTILPHARNAFLLFKYPVSPHSPPPPLPAKNPISLQFF